VTASVPILQPKVDSILQSTENGRRYSVLVFCWVASHHRFIALYVDGAMMRWRWSRDVMAMEPSSSPSYQRSIDLQDRWSAGAMWPNRTPYSVEPTGVSKSSVLEWQLNLEYFWIGQIILFKAVKFMLTICIRNITITSGRCIRSQSLSRVYICYCQER